MPQLKLNRPEVADKYDCTLETDTIVHTKGYSGKMSNINLEGADNLAKNAAGYLVEKKKKVTAPPAGTGEPK